MFTDSCRCVSGESATDGRLGRAAARACCGSASISAGVMETKVAASCALRMSVSTSAWAWMNSGGSGDRLKITVTRAAALVRQIRQ